MKKNEKLLLLIEVSSCREDMKQQLFYSSSSLAYTAVCMQQQQPDI
jgi:hypothetical protein